MNGGIFFGDRGDDARPRGDQSTSTLSTTAAPLTRGVEFCDTRDPDCS